MSTEPNQTPCGAAMTDHDHEDSRPAFEAFADANYVLAYISDEPSCEPSYRSRPAQDAWNAWRAALDYTASRECKWKYDFDQEAYEAECGETWAFMDGGPDHNEYRHCPGCGRKVKIQPTNDEL